LRNTPVARFWHSLSAENRSRIIKARAKKARASQTLGRMWTRRS
jgi:hypothetical protein